MQYVYQQMVSAEDFKKDTFCLEYSADKLSVINMSIVLAQKTD